MSMRRYVLVRAAWQIGLLFVFVTLAYVVAWVVPDKTLGHDPGYGGFLSNLAQGSLGRVAPPSGQECPAGRASTRSCGARPRSRSRCSS